MKSWHPSFPSFNSFVIVFYFLFRRLAKRDAAAYAQPNEPKIAAVSVEDLNNPEYEDAPQQEAQARSADYEADDLLGILFLQSYFHFCKFISFFL